LTIDEFSVSDQTLDAVLTLFPMGFHGKKRMDV
jgi:hypothetical protein